MTKVIARVHSVHVMNVEQHQAAADPQTKPHDLGCESAWFNQLSVSKTIFSVPVSVDCGYVLWRAGLTYLFYLLT